MNEQKVQLLHVRTLVLGFTTMNVLQCIIVKLNAANITGCVYTIESPCIVNVCSVRQIFALYKLPDMSCVLVPHTLSFVE